MTTLSFTNWVAALHNNYKLGTSSWKSYVKSTNSATLKGSFMNMLVEATKLSIKSLPNVVRVSSQSWARPTSFVKHASPALYYKVFSSTGSNPRWFTKTSAYADPNMHDIVVYHPQGKKPAMGQAANAMWGLMLIPMPKPGSTATFGKIQALPDEQVIDSQTLGMPVSINLFAGQESQEQKDIWKTIISNAAAFKSTFTIKVEIQRTNSPYGAATVPTFTRSGITTEEMTRIIDGEMIGTAIDEVQNYAAPPLGDAESVSVGFDYSAKFTVTTSYNGTTYTYEGDSADPASFLVLPERIGYTSTPEAYAELKNYGSGSNMNGTLSEDWEAMAGVPSTEQLYFAAGGSEFIVDITVEPVFDEVAKRSYDAYYTSVKCEFYEGDNSKTHTLGGTEVNTHTGGSYHAAGYPKTGNHPHEQNSYECALCGAVGYYKCTVDTTEYDAAVKEAEQLVKDINATVLTYTDASHDTTRSHSNWGAKMTKSSDTKSNAQKILEKGSGCNHGGHCTITSEKHEHKREDCVPGTPCTNTHAWSIDITFSVPAHVLCGPCCEHVLPEVHDTWSQTWTYDTMKIVDVHVWQIDQAAVNGLENIIATSADIGETHSASNTTLPEGTVAADIRQGRPNIFYNIALKKDANFTKQDGVGGATGTSAVGRVRYNLAGSWADANQHDTVKWNLGQRTSVCDGLSMTHSTTESPSISGGGHSEPKGKGFIYSNFKPSPSITGAKTKFTSVWTKNGAIGQQNWPTNQVGFLQANTDDVDKNTTEYRGFLGKREQSMTAWMITDFLILQTSNGDQSVLYFDAKNPSSSDGTPVTAESKIPDLNLEKEQMWHNNANSASRWQADHINVGGYNGNFNNPSRKFTSSNKGNAVVTIFDGREGGGRDPAQSIVRPTRPNRNLMLYNGKLNIIAKNNNKKYATGKAEVFWANLLHWTDVTSIRFNTNPAPAPYSTTSNLGEITKYNFSTHCGVINTGNTHCVTSSDLKSPGFAPKFGVTLEAPYSASHEKINDIIIHDPVSTENVALVSLPDERDQRYGEVIGADMAENMEDKLNVCPGEAGLCDFRELVCTYFDNVKVAEIDFDSLDGSGNPLNKITKNSIKLPSGFSLATAPSGSTKLSKTVMRSSSGIRVEIPVSELKVQYSPSLKLKVSLDFRTTSLSSKQMLVSMYGYGLYINEAGKIGFTTNKGDFREATNITIKANTDYHIDVIMSYKRIDSCELTVNNVKASFTKSGTSPSDFTTTEIGGSLNIGSLGSSTAYKFNGYIDNIVVTRLAGTAEHTEDCYTIIMSHPSGLNYHEHTLECLETGPKVQNIGYKASAQKVQLEPGEYLLEAWGASGGGDTDSTRGSAAGLGGYSSGTYTITKPTTLYVYTGGQGTLSTGIGTGGGYNGGGHAGAGGYGGGGMTYISTNGNDNINTTFRIPESVTRPRGTFTGQASFKGKTESSWSDPNNSWTTVKKFKATSDGTIVFQSTSYTVDPVARILVNGAVVDTDDDGADGLNFRVRANVKANDTILIQVSSYNTTNGSCNWSCSHPGVIDVGINHEIQYNGTFNYGNVILLAGGGGGADNKSSEISGNNDDGSGGSGGGSSGGGAKINGRVQASTGGTQSSGFKRGFGESASFNIDTGGGGGGWYGGKATNNTNGGGGGGSGYISNKVTSGSTKAGINLGNGKVRITKISNASNVIENIILGKYSESEAIKILGSTVYNKVKEQLKKTPPAVGGDPNLKTGDIRNYTYTGGVQSIYLPAGTYLLQTWGAQGGSTSSSYSGGKGGYSAGTLKVTKPQTLYIYVGGAGSSKIGGFNGGGSALLYNGGGGATHMALSNPGTVTTPAPSPVQGRFSAATPYCWRQTASGCRYNGRYAYSSSSTSFSYHCSGWVRVPEYDYGKSGLIALENKKSDVVIVAGGGGGAAHTGDGGAGGGISGIAGASSSGSSGAGGTQTSAGYGGSFGFGGEAPRHAGGGGGGYYGGGAGGDDCNDGGGGGSGYINTRLLTGASTIAGNAAMPNPSGGNMTGNSGNGYARITAIKVNNGISDSLWNTILNIIKDNWKSIPYWKGNVEGVINPIWNCGYMPINAHKCDNKCNEILILNCKEPHHENMHYDGSNEVCWQPCLDDEKHKKFKDEIITTDGRFTPGNFINLDWGFDIYFPNIGDYYQGEPHGIGSLTTTRGLGFINNLDTSDWTKVKRVKFNVNVIRNGHLYMANQWITLADRGVYEGDPGDPYDERLWSNYGTELYNAIKGDLINGKRSGIYHFYCVEANEEIASSKVKVEVEAINGKGYNDNTESTTNRTRYSSFKSLHGATNYFYMDVVGRIGNLVLEDTGDYRFSNLFKQTIESPELQAPSIYTLGNSGLNIVSGAKNDSGKVSASIPGAGAEIESIDLTAGQYKITVKGNKLNNGKINITTQSGWKTVGEFDSSTGIVVDEKQSLVDPSIPDGIVQYDYTVTGPNVELDSGKYRIEVYGQGFLQEEWKLRTYNPATDIYTDLTDQCEHTGTTDNKATFILDLSYDIHKNSTCNGLEVYCEAIDNIGFSVDNVVIKKLDTETTKDIANTDAVSRVTVSSQIMSYYVNIASDTPATITYTATNSGGMVVESVSIQRLGDYDDSWIVEGIIKRVDESKQNEYFSWGINDIRGVKVSKDTQWLNTYSTQNWMNKAPLRLPLDPSKNNIAILRDEPMLVGYDLYMDISTIGSYFMNNRAVLQVIPYYYAIDLNNKHVDPIPVDAYLKYSKGYYPVNIFGLVTGKNKNVVGASEEYKSYTMSDIYNFTMNLDWVEESVRRNYTNVEKYQTESLSNMLIETIDGVTRNLFIPTGHSYNMGNSQFLQINGKARTFIGGETTYGQLMNLGGSNKVTTDSMGRKYNKSGKIRDDLWWRFAQRWHFTMGLPSSTVFVRQGTTPDANTIQEFQKANYVVIACADIRALGEVWQLRYSHGTVNDYGHTNGEDVPGDNGQIIVTTTDGTSITYPIPEKLPPAIAVYSTVKSSEFDVSIVGIH